MTLKRTCTCVRCRRSETIDPWQIAPLGWVSDRLCRGCAVAGHYEERIIWRMGREQWARQIVREEMRR